MLWALDNPDAPAIVAGYQHYGAPIPAALIPPALHDVELDLWAAFVELSTEGQRVPWTAIKAYHDANPHWPWEVLHGAVRALDNARANHSKTKQGGDHG